MNTEIIITHFNGRYGLNVFRGTESLHTTPPTQTPDEIAKELKAKYKPEYKITGPDKILKLAGLKGNVGRPGYGDLYLPAIKVSKEMSEALKRYAKRKKISMPELRRLAYRNIVQK